MNIKFIIRQYVKMAVQSILLPCVYRFYKRKPVAENKIIFADAHKECLPYSMEWFYGQIDKEKWDIHEYFLDYQKNGYLTVVKSMLSFMKDYATARYVFICDNFLPVSSCKKRQETTVVQLWHAGGILKKYAYDTEDDIPKYYKGNVFSNYDVVTVSAPVCVPVYESAMRLKKGSVYPIGLSRTDCFFNKEYIEGCKQNFYKQYPKAKGKKLLLWAPTFRGKASDPYLVGEQWVKRLEKDLNALSKKEEWYVLIRVHPHLDSKKQLSNCNIPTEQLLPVIDLLISDCSSVIFDYVLLKKPLVLYFPDIEEMEEKRGFYIPLTSIPGKLVTNGEELAKEVADSFEQFDEKELETFRDKYMGACDGNATKRLMDMLAINEKQSRS